MPSNSPTPDLNPYASPGEIAGVGGRSYFWETIALGWPVIFVGIPAGTFLGALLTAANYELAPIASAGLRPVFPLSDHWLAMVIHGLYEGGLFGAFNSIILLLAAGWLVPRLVDYWPLSKIVLTICLAVLAFWLLGGLLFSAVVFSFPKQFPAFHVGIFPNLQLAWLHGSMDAARLGSPLCTLVAVLLFRSNLTWVDRIPEAERSTKP